MKIFIAGPLFSEAEREFNRKVDAFLQDKEFDTFLPQRDVGKLDRSLRERAVKSHVETYKEDLAGLNDADAVVAILDGVDVDSGTAFEIGYATARGKPVIGLRTDMRVFAKGEELNNMLTQSIRSVARNLDKLASELRNLASEI